MNEGQKRKRNRVISIGGVKKSVKLTYSEAEETLLSLYDEWITEQKQRNSAPSSSNNNNSQNKHKRLKPKRVIRSSSLSPEAKQQIDNNDDDDAIDDDDDDYDVLEYNVKTKLPNAIDKKTKRALQSQLPLPGHDKPLMLCANPHARQRIHVGHDRIHLSMGFRRQLAEYDPQMKYQRRSNEVKTVLHWAQRGHLLNIMEFLSLHAHDESHTVLYVGTLSYESLLLLTDLYANCTFYVIYSSNKDNRSNNVKDSERLFYIHSEVTSEILAQFEATTEQRHNRELLFICDRNTRKKTNDNDVTDDITTTDMIFQQEWFLRLRPARALLRFELPWSVGTTTYVSGRLLLPVYGAPTGTTCYLETLPFKERNEEIETTIHDHRKYEQQMFYFNTHKRVECFPHRVCVHGVDHCFDCSSEISILYNYVSVFYGDYIEGLKDSFSPLQSIRINQQQRIAHEKHIDISEVDSNELVPLSLKNLMKNNQMNVVKTLENDPTKLIAGESMSFPAGTDTLHDAEKLQRMIESIESLIKLLSMKLPLPKTHV